MLANKPPTVGAADCSYQHRNSFSPPSRSEELTKRRQVNHRIRLVLVHQAVDLLLVPKVAVLGRQKHPLFAVTLAETRVDGLMFDHVADGRANEAGALACVRACVRWRLCSEDTRNYPGCRDQKREKRGRERRRENGKRVEERNSSR